MENKLKILQEVKNISKTGPKSVLFSKGKIDKRLLIS